MKFRAHANSEARDDISSAFYFGRTKRAIIQGLSHNHQMTSRSVFHLEQVLIVGKSQARALKDARCYRQTHEVVKYAIEYAKKYITLTHFHNTKHICILRELNWTSSMAQSSNWRMQSFGTRKLFDMIEITLLQRRALNGLRRPSTSVTAEIGKSRWTIA